MIGKLKKLKGAVKPALLKTSYEQYCESNYGKVARIYE